MAVTLKQAVESHIEELVSQGLAKSTVTCRASYLRRFARKSDEMAKSEGKRGGCRPAHLTPAYVARFFAAVGGSQGNRNNALLALRRFFDWLERMRYVEPNTAVWLLGGRKIAAAQREPKYYIKAEHFATMLDIAGEWHPGERAMIAIALYTLCRSSEIAFMRLKHINLVSRTVSIWRAKTKRWTEMAICPELFDELNTWLAWYANDQGYATAAEMIEKCPEWYVIPKRQYYAGKIDGRTTPTPPSSGSSLRSV